MNMPNKFVKTLFDKDYQKLVENYQTSSNFRVRNRSQTILLSFQKYAVDKIAQICRVHRTTSCIWIDKWNAHQKLEDQERSSHPTILNLEEQKKAVDIGLQTFCL